MIRIFFDGNNTYAFYILVNKLTFLYRHNYYFWLLNYHFVFSFLVPIRHCNTKYVADMMVFEKFQSFYNI